MRADDVSSRIVASAAALLLACALFSPVPAPAASPAASPVRFTEFLISSDYTYPYGIDAADLDGDGDLDLTSADALPNNDLYWFENDGKSGFRRHFIQMNDPERLERHAVADVDRDGHPDVVIVENLRGDLKWFRNSGTPQDNRLWKRHYITRGTLPGAYDVAVADLDRDGDLDVAASSWSLGNQFAWFENDGTPLDEEEWTKHEIELNIAETRTIRAGDLDGDRDIDLLGTACGPGLVLWYENPGRRANRPWKKHVIDTIARPLHGQPADLDRDGDLDVVMAAGMGGGQQPVSHHVIWYENPGRPAYRPWKKHVIGDDFEQAFEAVAADLDGDRDVDVVATAWGDRGRIAWFENPGDPRGNWRMHPLKENWVRANQVIVADLNGDRRPDIAAVAERGSLEFRWWRNEGRNAARD